jgi:predicted transcriptional regulator
MDTIYRLGKATAADVEREIAGPPGDGSVRKLLRILEAKGHLTHRRRGREHVYAPTVPRSRARRAALARLVATFFDGSEVEAAAALLRSSKDRLTPRDAARLSALIENAAREGR